MLYPVFKHTYDRYTQPINLDPMVIRDSVVAWRKDLGRSVDYLETRADIDASKLGYIAYRSGASRSSSNSERPPPTSGASSSTPVTRSRRPRRTMRS